MDLSEKIGRLAEVYMLKEKTERQLEEVYQSRKPYLNQKDSCEELHEMCRNCEFFCGQKTTIIQNAEILRASRTGSDWNI